MTTWKRLLSIALVLGVAAGHAPGTATAPAAGWVETFAMVGGSQYQPGTAMHLDYGVANNSVATQDVVFAGAIRFSDGSHVVVHPRERLTLLPGDSVIRFGSFLLPQSAPLGPAEFLVGAFVRGPGGTLQGPRLVYDTDVFDVVP